MRFCIIYVNGGVYADLDFYCRSNLISIIKDKKEVFYREVPEHEPQHKQLYNGFFASVPNIKFIRGLARRNDLFFRKI